MPIDHVHALPSGTRFEEYRLDAVLGSGGFGITYRAYDGNLDKFVAIKEYLPVEFATRTEASTVVPHSSADAQDYHWGLSRFLDEARILARFDHPNLNKVYRFFESNGTAYMVLEYIHGETLASRLSKEPYLEEAALDRLLEEVLSGLALMHEAGYVHRDIKPGNLMLREEDGSAVLLDFGAARQAVGQRSKPITSILTPGYAPVEQYDGKVDRVGPWTDLYALGMVAYRGVSGLGDSELPDAVARMLAQSRGEAVLLPAVEAGKGKYNPKLLEAVDWAMEVDEHDRPQNVGAWRQALTGAGVRKGASRPAPKSATRPAGTATTGRSGMRWTSMALAVVIVALLGVGGWWGWRLYQGQPGVVMDAAVTPAESPTDRQSQPQAGVGPDEQTGDVPAGTGLDETAKTTPQTADAGEAALADSAGAGAAQPATRPDEVSPAKEDEVARLLAAAEADIEARRLTSPAGNNAWEKYQRVLRLSPANPAAMAGVDRVIGSYMELFATAVKQEDFDKAESYLVRIRDLHPDSPELEEGARRIEDAKQARAERLMSNQAVREHLDSFEGSLRQDRLDEAAASLERIRALSPTAPGLSEAEQRLAEARQAEVDRHEASFEQALREGNIDEAATHLERVRALHPNTPGLAAAEQRLAETRQAETERRRQAEEAELARQRREIEAQVKQLTEGMVAIPGGQFRMGSERILSKKNEKPVHRVRVPTFRLGKHEVTFAQWDACVADGGCKHKPNDEGWGRGNRPVINVSWDDVQQFIEWLNDKMGGNYRLPSEAEWEYAARAGSTTKYSWGNDFGSNRANCANYGCGDRYENTAPVGSFPANAWSLHDMHGNVYEWVQDCWNGSYNGAPSDGSAWLSGNCSLRVIRGGSWNDVPANLRSANRLRDTRTDRDYNRGFRLAQDN